jgi:hypothetical protein
VAESAAGAEQGNGFTTAVLWVTAVVALGVTAAAVLMSDEIADALPFSRGGTVATLSLIAVFTSIGSFVVGRRTGGLLLRRCLIGLLSAGFGLIALAALTLIAAGGIAVGLIFLLVPAAIEIGMICRALIKSPATGEAVR